MIALNFVLTSESYLQDATAATDDYPTWLKLLH